MQLSRHWNKSIIVSLYLCLYVFRSFFPAPVKQVSCSVTQFLVAMLTAAGANGLPGLTAPPSVEAGLRSGRVSVITPPLRVEAESVWDPADSRKPATLTTAQVSPCDRCCLSHTQCAESLYSLTVCMCLL